MDTVCKLEDLAEQCENMRMKIDTTQKKRQIKGRPVRSQSEERPANTSQPNTSSKSSTNTETQPGKQTARPADYLPDSGVPPPGCVPPFPLDADHIENLQQITLFDAYAPKGTKFPIITTIPLGKTEEKAPRVKEDEKPPAGIEAAQKDKMTPEGEDIPKPSLPFPEKDSGLPFDVKYKEATNPPRYPGTAATRTVIQQKNRSGYFIVSLTNPTRSTWEATLRCVEAMHQDETATFSPPPLTVNPFALPRPYAIPRMRSQPATAATAAAAKVAAARAEATKAAPPTGLLRHPLGGEEKCKTWKANLPFFRSLAESLPAGSTFKRIDDENGDEKCDKEVSQITTKTDEKWETSSAEDGPPSLVTTSHGSKCDSRESDAVDEPDEGDESDAGGKSGDSASDGEENKNE